VQVLRGLMEKFGDTFMTLWRAMWGVDAAARDEAARAMWRLFYKQSLHEQETAERWNEMLLQLSPVERAAALRKNTRNFEISEEVRRRLVEDKALAAAARQSAHIAGVGGNGGYYPAPYVHGREDGGRQRQTADFGRRAGRAGDLLSDIVGHEPAHYLDIDFGKQRQ